MASEVTIGVSLDSEPLNQFLTVVNGYFTRRGIAFDDVNFDLSDVVTIESTSQQPAARNAVSLVARPSDGFIEHVARLIAN